MECDPTARVEVVKVALPVPSSVPVPSVVAASLKVTAPVGTPLPGAVAVTAAVNVTGWLKTEGLADELTAVVVALAPAWFTTWGEAASLPLLPSQPLVPVKVAVMVWLPAASAAVLKAAAPAPLTGTLEARTVEPSANVTLPVGTPPVPVTVAVNVTD